MPLRQLKQVHKGDRALCYHGKPEHSLYALAEVSRDPYPDPHDSESKKLVMDLRAIERLPRIVKLTEMRDDRLLRKIKFLKNTRLTICPLTDEEYAEILKHGRNRRLSRYPAALSDRNFLRDLCFCTSVYSVFRFDLHSWSDRMCDAGTSRSRNCGARLAGRSARAAHRGCPPRQDGLHRRSGRAGKGLARKQGSAA